MDQTAVERLYQDGQTIIEQGEPAMEAFLILEGTVHVCLEKNGTTTQIASLGEGEIFGEAALFKGSDYGATIKAASKVTVMPITPAVLDGKIAKCDPMIRAIIRMLMVRLRKSNAAAASGTVRD